MKTSFAPMARGWLAAAFMLLGISDIGHAQGYSARHHEIVSQMQIMARGAYTEAEWNEVIGRLDNLLLEGRAAGDWEGVVETQVIRAKVMAARGQHADAMALMQNTLTEFRDHPLQSVKKVYVEIATLHARNGDEEAVARTMRAFKASPHFDGKTYSFSGGSGPLDPLVVPRPSVAVGDSVSVTAMEVQRTRARFAPGQAFPDFNAVDWAGRPLSAQDLLGKVTLVDFWTEGWFAWRRDLEFRKGIYERHRGQGYEVIGLYLGRDQNAGQAFANANGMTWRQAAAPRPLLKTLGIFGNVSNFLVDRDGLIIGRDLHAADLDAAVRRALQR